MQKNNPAITVIIPTFNRAEYLAECLDSLLAQSLPASQIIVVDDGSTDHTQSVLENYRGKIECYSLNQLGKPSAINHGLKRSTGEYLWIFDDDDVALPEALERFVAPLMNNPGYSFSYSTFFYTDSDSTTNRIGRVHHELKIPDLTARGFLVPLLEFNFLGGAALFARASCYKEVGDFDEVLLRSQDYEMAVRIARRFKGIRVEGPPTFHYRQHEGERGQSRDRFSANERIPKWHAYDQMFFPKIYEKIPLVEYLPPGEKIEGNTRRALLVRMSVMSLKGLIDEVLNDLEKLAELSDAKPFSPEEYLTLRTMIMARPYSQTPTAFDYPQFFTEMRRLASQSAQMRLFRAKVLRALLARLRARPSFKNFVDNLYHIFLLYI